MSFSLTVVHAPGALSNQHWSAVRRQAPGAYDHELRFVVDASADSVSGAGLDQALRTMLQAPTVRLSTAGHELHTIDLGSDLLHAGMVILVSPPTMTLTSLRAPQLKLCVDSGPDAGRLVPLQRGRTTVGRGRAEIRIADPAMSRQAAVLQVGTRAITLHRTKRPNDDAAARLITEAGFQLGSTTCRIAVEPPAPRVPQPWPPVPEAVAANPPEGKHKMMLAFALVPLVAGVVLVAFTGMWFFLLFSGASALVASVIFWDGRRKLRQYRREVVRAAHTWASRTFGALCSPGELMRDLRADSSEPVHAGSAEDGAPAVRLGTGQVTAEVDCGSASPPAATDTRVQAAVGITLAAGEQTTIEGADREAQRLIRWILSQLTLCPTQAQIVLIGGLSVQEVRDLSPVSQLSAEAFRQLLDSDSAPTEKAQVLVIADPQADRCAHRALAASWHVLTVGPGQPGADGWSVDLRSQTVKRQVHAGSSAVSAEQLMFDGLSTQTLSEQLRLTLPLLRRTASAGEIPASCTYPLPQQMFTETAADTLTAVLGRNGEGIIDLDLVGDGPHILIAGTTGSGKSELLKTLLVSLCARYAPSELGLVLIDFKGGAAFHRIGQLEHALGLVTDLSQAAAERTLEGIRSELVRRERLFLEVGAGDYCEYRQLCPERQLSRILVVIDEFRIFSHELPDQLDELMRLATLGRSLGFHLVLSTQRPQGVVTADIRANIGSSICLRVRSEDESRDVLGSPLAAAIPPTVPGRAALRTSGEGLTVFQSAQLAGHRPLYLRPETRPAPPAPRASFSEVIAAVHEAASKESEHRTHTPLLPALPEGLGAHERLGDDAATHPLVARVDDPAGQRQEDLVLNPQEPISLALLGEVGSGAAAAATALTAQLIESPLQPDVYLLDGDRSLAAFKDQSRVGSWLTEEDTAEVDYLLSALSDELTRRRVGRAHLTAERLRPLVVIVTGYSQWNAAAHTGLQSLDHLLGTLASEGPQVGISVVLCGGRELAMGKLLSRVPTRIYLPLGTSEEARYLWPKLRSTDPVPGRGVLLTPHVPPPGLTVQLVTEQPSLLEATAQGDVPALQVRPLPERLPTTALPAFSASLQEENPHPIVGIQQFTGAPARFQLGPVNLILGPAGSGKSTCLQILHQQLEDSHLLTPDSTAPASTPSALLVDDAPRCTAQQQSYIQHAVTAGVPVVATAAASSALFTQLPWAYAARTEGSNVILSPTSRNQADVFAAVIPLLPRPIPGRAVHLRPEGAVMVQWALPGA
jgi:DNA segregation ATPase FtsK/SpoIIIE, S-DNA-T family